MARVREDFHRQPWISYDEAAIESGLSRGHIRNLTTQGKIRRAKAGAYRVDHLSLKQYLGIA